MKTIYFVRHAKASQDYGTYGDFERPLLPVGIKRTKKICQFLKAKGIAMDVIICSPAKRTFETAKLIAKEINFKESAIETAMSIYDGNEESILNEIFTASNEASQLMLVGHNPTITHLVNLFAYPIIDFLPTAGIASISFETDDWSKIMEVPKETNFVIFPKML